MTAVTKFLVLGWTIAVPPVTFLASMASSEPLQVWSSGVWVWAVVVVPLCCIGLLFKRGQPW